MVNLVARVSKIALRQGTEDVAQFLDGRFAIELALHLIDDLKFAALNEFGIIELIVFRGVGRVDFHHIVVSLVIDLERAAVFEDDALLDDYSREIHRLVEHRGGVELQSYSLFHLGLAHHSGLSLEGHGWCEGQHECEAENECFFHNGRGFR